MTNNPGRGGVFNFYSLINHLVVLANFVNIEKCAFKIYGLPKSLIYGTPYGPCNQSGER